MSQMLLRPFALLLISTSLQTFAQSDPETNLDSLYIIEVEEAKEIDKVLHAEPLFIDLIRNLGARKGEKEWNVGFGINPRRDYDQIETLIEYEWAPIDRLGLEIEFPFSFYLKQNGSTVIPSNRLNSIKLAAQWSLLVNQKNSTSLALGYLHEFEMAPFIDYSRSQLFTGNIFSPFVVAAKRWGMNWHTLIYTGPMIFQEYNYKGLNAAYQLHSNFHYMLTGTRNFVGLEINKYFGPEGSDITLRPQMRIGVKDNLILGIVTGIALGSRNDRVSSFLRLIYEPSSH